MSKQIALIFDLDGTLIHSLPDLRNALNLLLAEEKRRSLGEEEVALMIGDGVRMLVAQGLQATGAAAEDDAALDALTARFMVHYEAAPAAETRPYPGVVETLEELVRRGHPLAICTNKPISATMDLLRMLELERFFDAVIGGGSTPDRKPAPGPVRAALDRLNAPPAEALMIGDSVNDVLSARAAGVRCAAVTYGYPRGPVEALGADILIDSFPEVLGLLEMVEG
ncbi:phosphoglycolate phosphatase [Telmatospirillum sp. J64-1]|uniref:phosphoglycolate phosphatase n=1 Tax=Telmatospirillum sp. J64-1 TaxID=2502183 RepID=UPI00115D6ABA|nr:phosphoglycolate phosphatase [Telmatospirillum sp. J64-1]